MQPIFTLNVMEFKVADKLNAQFKECSIFIPASSQEKGIDLILYNRTARKNKAVTIQVKSSRTYYGDNEKSYKNYLWLNRFEPQENADLFMLTGLYPKYNKTIKETNFQNIKWETLILVFTYKEMAMFLDNIRLKTDPQKHDKMFAFGFDNEDEIFLTRGNSKVFFGKGSAKNKNMEDYRLENRIGLIENLFK